VADADDLERTLEGLVQQTDDPHQTADTIMDVLARHETTTTWMHRFLETSNRERSTYQSPPGMPGFLETPIYTCPHGGCRWTIRNVGDHPKRCHQNNEPMGTAQQPRCPVHNVALEVFQREP
jgi:hypothetical protein